MSSLTWIPMISVFLMVGMILYIAFDQLGEQQKFENFCEQNGFQNNISKPSGFASSNDYCIDSNGKLLEAICDGENCYFLEDLK